MNKGNHGVHSRIWSCDKIFACCTGGLERPFQTMGHPLEQDLRGEDGLLGGKRSKKRAREKRERERERERERGREGGRDI